MLSGPSAMAFRPRRVQAWAECNNPNEFFDLEEEEQVSLVFWIRDNLDPLRIKSFPQDGGPTSYSLKHNFERSPGGFYITNGQMKGAMLHCDFEPKDQDNINWTFRLSKKARQVEGPVRQVILPK